MNVSLLQTLLLLTFISFCSSVFFFTSLQSTSCGNNILFYEFPIGEGICTSFIPRMSIMVSGGYFEYYDDDNCTLNPFLTLPLSGACIEGGNNNSYSIGSFTDGQEIVRFDVYNTSCALNNIQYSYGYFVNQCYSFLNGKSIIVTFDTTSVYISNYNISTSCSGSYSQQIFPYGCYPYEYGLLYSVQTEILHVMPGLITTSSIPNSTISFGNPLLPSSFPLLFLSFLLIF